MRSRPLILLVVTVIVGGVLLWLGRVTEPTPLDDIPPAPRAGAPAPDFVLTALDGESYRLSALRGQVVVVNLWATWCPPCRREMPTMQKVYEQYVDEGLEIFAVNQAENPAQVQRFVDEFGLTFPILLDADASVGRAYDLAAYPSTYFIGRDGQIAEFVFGGPMAEGLFESIVVRLLEED